MVITPFKFIDAGEFAAVAEHAARASYAQMAEPVPECDRTLWLHDNGLFNIGRFPALGQGLVISYAADSGYPEVGDLRNRLFVNAVKCRCGRHVGEHHPDMRRMSDVSTRACASYKPTRAGKRA